MMGGGEGLKEVMGGGEGLKDVKWERIDCFVLD